MHLFLPGGAAVRDNSNGPGTGRLALTGTLEGLGKVVGTDHGGLSESKKDTLRRESQKIPLVIYTRSVQGSE